MLDELHTYSLADFIPFTVEVYLRLVERQNEAMWPAQFAALLLGIGALVLIARGRGRWAAMLLGAAWAWVAFTFHLRLYAELTWAAYYFGGAFLLQAALMLVCGVFGQFGAGGKPGAKLPTVLGYGLAGFGLAVYPLLAPLTGRGWAGAECFGIMPDPTAATTLGLILIAARRGWLPILLLIPLLWCAVSGATAWSLNVSLALCLPVAAAITVVGAVWKGMRRTAAKHA